MAGSQPFSARVELCFIDLSGARLSHVVEVNLGQNSQTITVSMAVAAHL